MQDRIKITIPIEDCNSFSQKIYDDYVLGLQIHMMKCKCGHCGCMTLYGRYSRNLKILGLILSLIIQRVKCSSCGKTHVLIPSLIVPYSQIPRKDQQEILKLSEEGKSAAPVLDQNCQIDESHVRHIIRRFKSHWKERIRYSPDFSETYVVEPSGELTSIDMRPLNKKDNSLIKREKVRLSTSEGEIS